MTKADIVQQVAQIAGNPTLAQGAAAIIAAWFGTASQILLCNVEGETWNAIRRYVNLHMKTIIVSLMWATMVGAFVVGAYDSSSSIWAIITASFTTAFTSDRAFDVVRKGKDKRSRDNLRIDIREVP